MDVLVVGSDAAGIAPAVVAAATAAGHTASAVPAIDAVPATGEWDGVVVCDVDDHRPIVRAVESLATRTGHLTLLTTLAVYDRPVGEGTTPDATRVDPPPPGEDGTLAARQRAAEDAVTGAFGARCTVVRRGALAGAGDVAGRVTWWLRRCARGGDVLAPGDPAGPVQLLDTRDLADFLVHVTDEGEAGPFHAAAPSTPYSFRDLLDACRDVTGADASFVWAPDVFLSDHRVRPWDEAPLWLPSVGGRREGQMAVDVTGAVAAGLRWRPLLDTLRHVDESDAAAGRPPLSVGIDPQREVMLLALARTQQ